MFVTLAGAAADVGIAANPVHRHIHGVDAVSDLFVLLAFATFGGRPRAAAAASSALVATLVIVKKDSFWRF